jgi:NAD(P)-dependent dehydrogenase (short-subunit alcohol dehydrogenase family)
MRIIVVGATGTIGKAVADALEARDHQVLRASRKGELPVDIQDPESIKHMYEVTGEIDGVVACVGNAAWKPLTELEDTDLTFSIANKLLGNVNLVRFGVNNMRDKGVFLLTAGIFSQEPPPGVPAIAMVNGALESFARGAAKDLPRGIRINTVSPPFIKETAESMGMDGGLPSADNARAYVELVEGTQTGQVVYPK